ncbi:MAG TPA: Holliday junction resolvase RuvX [Chloroflexota bacterium]|nr:Holliday junction resolvase RuvX [Chloroflexota bacterium]
MTGVVLGLDVGERRIGVAKSDPSGVLASPLTTLLRVSDRDAVAAIGALAAEHGAMTLVVGVPLGPEGEVTDQARRVRALGRKLRSLPGARVVFWDERSSTQEAQESLRAGRPRRGAPSARRREAIRREIDAAAAAVILQSYLDQYDQQQ